MLDEEKNVLSSRRANVLAEILVLMVVSHSAFGQTSHNHRAEFGELRATVMESIISRIHPGSRFQWDPDLRIQIGRRLREVTFPGFTLIATSDGRFEGATGIEFGNDKEEFIHDEEHLKSAAPQKFATDLVVFQTDARGTVSQLKIFPLDPSDPLTKVKLIEVKGWPLNSWPAVRIQYVSHFTMPDSFTKIEWNAVFDTNNGRFVSRLPLGITRTTKGGAEEIHPLALSRKDPNTLRISDEVAKTVSEQSCSDPCVVDGPTLLRQWAQ